MNGFLSDMNTFQSIFFVISVSSTVILVIQTILAIIGLANNNDTDAQIGESYVSDGGHEGIDVDVQTDTDVGTIDMGTEAEFDAAHHDSGGEIHHDSDGLRLFTVRGILSFLTMGGWVGFLFSRSGLNEIISLICALVSGMIALYLMAQMMRALIELQEDGSTKMKNALGKIGQVYIRIPGEEKGKGKVNVTVQEKLCEFDAVTEKSETIQTGELVYVTDIRAENVLVVEKVEEDVD